MLQAQVVCIHLTPVSGLFICNKYRMAQQILKCAARKDSYYVSTH